MPFSQLQKGCLALAAIALVAFFIGLIAAVPMLAKLAAIATVVCLAIGLGSVPSLAGYQFTAWILAAVLAAMLYPERFLQVGPLDLRNKWLVLVVVQLVMFGMGTKMSIRDFAGVVKMPYPILVGITLQFLVMPLTGYALAKLFGFPPEIAAGVVLIGSCSSGLASNVMCYLAGANLALSISLTAIATLLAPLATPFWMQTLAGEFVEVDTMEMAMQIVRIVLVPIGAALFHDFLTHTSAGQKSAAIFSAVCVAVVLAIVGFSAMQGGSTATRESAFIFSAAIVFALAYHFLAERFAWIGEQMHVFSMFGIIYFTLVTTAAGRDNLIVAGAALFAAAILHNLIGYTLGYLLSRAVGLDRQSALTVGFEVGMQNGGMASGLAGLMGKLGTVGLAAAVFSPWMNISGSVLANQIRKYRQRSSHELPEPTGE